MPSPSKSGAGPPSWTTPTSTPSRPGNGAPVTRPPSESDGTVDASALGVGVLGVGASAPRRAARQSADSGAAS
jgi:hypothetical protein